MSILQGTNNSETTGDGTFIFQFDREIDILHRVVSQLQRNYMARIST